MSSENNSFAAPLARDIEHIRRIKVAPLLAAGLSVRAISTATGIPVGAVHRAKRQLEKEAAQGRQKAIAMAQQLPTSYVVKQDIGGVPQDVRRLTVAVYERAVESAIGRGLLGRNNDQGNPWIVLSALFAGMFDDHTIEWLNRRGYLNWDQRGQGEAIIAAINAVIGRQR
jgi:hypothetical protein